MLLKAIELQTNNLINTLNFYSGTLELPVIDKSEKAVSFRIGSSTLTFTLAEQSRPFYHLAFLIPANRIQAALQWVSEKTTILDFSSNNQIASFDNWNAKAFYFHDTQGNILECIARVNLGNTAETSFNAASLLSINEIGIPVENVTHFCEGLHSNLCIPYFKKGPKFQDFIVMGEEEGLLIVTKIGRGWLPTQRPAELHPISITIELQANIINLQM